jgi:UDPglucose 6-dehydrogenase
MKIAIVGTGYVGLVSSACFAELGHEVVGVDIDEAKVRMLKSGKSPIYEPELEELIQRNISSGRLSFTTELSEAIPGAQVVFSAVATPPNADYSADLRAVFTVAESVAEHAVGNLVFVNKSTVPVGTGSKCEDSINAILKRREVPHKIPVISNPEFLREGCAVHDTMQPDRIIVGINGDAHAKQVMEELYQPLTRVGKPLLVMSRESSEIVKYASNAFLAAKISFINMISELCETTGGSVREVAAGMGLDNRIGPRFLHAGVGYGGSCFPKDVKALIALSKETGVPLPLVKATHDMNNRQRQRFFKKVIGALPPNAAVTVWGLSFKPKTDDLREAPSLDLIPMLTRAGHKVTVYDPVSMEKARLILKKRVNYATSHMDAAKDADAVIVMTEWDLFRGVDLRKLKETMRGKELFDGRNVYEPSEAREAGLTYWGIGVK